MLRRNELVSIVSGTIRDFFDDYSILEVGKPVFAAEEAAKAIVEAVLRHIQNETPQRKG